MPTSEPAASSSPAGLALTLEQEWERIEPVYQRLESVAKAARPSDDVATLRAAYEFARERHGLQRRQDGELFITHPVEVATVLAEMQMDQVCILTAILHDTLEDTRTNFEELRTRFGAEVARCVNGVTKLGRLHLGSKEDRQAESLRKMFIAMSEDIRVILVKLADRLHNMRTLSALDPSRQQRIAAETLEVYAPIAHRLGMGKIRSELEDLGFRYLEPESHAEITGAIETRRQATEDVLLKIRQTVEQKLAAEGIPARVQGRIKRSWSVYQKLKRQRINIDQVYDLLGIRIITDSVKNCYAALGIMHHEWHPIPGRIKDFIAIPRPNLYQSLHTSVMGPSGVSFEVQIRTEEMHRLAEEGIAAHWKYKEGRKGAVADERQIAWLRQLVEWQKETPDPSAFMSNLRVDLYAEEVYCFTPRGRVIVLPRDATPVDFAYAIHSDVGHTCNGAKVNGRMVPLKHPLRNGDIVEILTATGSSPSRDWLSFVKTTRARNKIRHVINTTERERAVEIGQKLIEREARRAGVSLGRIPKGRWEEVATEYGCSKAEDLQAALGWGKYSARQVLAKVSPDIVEPPVAPELPAGQARRPEPQKPGEAAVVYVKGVDDVVTYLAKCCNPIKGEPIVGYITRGKGVAVHSTKCKNVENLLYESERRIAVDWDRDQTKECFKVRLVIHTDDRTGILAKLTQILFDDDINIRSVESHSSDERLDDAVVEMSIEVRDRKQLDRVSGAMRRVPGVRDIERVQ